MVMDTPDLWVSRLGIALKLEGAVFMHADRSERDLDGGGGGTLFIHLGVDVCPAVRVARAEAPALAHRADAVLAGFKLL